MTRFVILHHTQHGGEHWDLMLEHEGALLTWQLLSEPRSCDSLPIAAQRIGNHRLAYLDYEGPISGNRGVVRRIEAGAVCLREFYEDRCQFTLEGRRFTGAFRLTASGDQWSFEVDTSGD